MTEFDWFSLAPYFALFLCVLMILAKARTHWVAGVLTLATLLGLGNQTLEWESLVALGLLPITVFVWINHYMSELLRKFAFVVFLFIGGSLAFHKFPGFNNFKVFDQLVFSPGSAPFDMYFNFDKIYLGIVVFMMLPRLERQVRFRDSYFTVAKYLFGAVFLLLPLAYFSGFVQYHPNTNPYLLVWAVNNLFFVCFTEEVLFRRFLQNYLVTYFRNTQYGDIVAIFLAAVVFGLAHFAGGFVYVGLATVAGILYGLCFYHTCNVRSSMALHFGVNLIHAALFTYPFAA